jgi:hypothetical protein
MEPSPLGKTRRFPKVRIATRCPALRDMGQTRAMQTVPEPNARSAIGHPSAGYGHKAGGSREDAVTKNLFRHGRWRWLDPMGTNLADGYGFNQSGRYLTASLIVKAGPSARSS